MLIEIVLTGDPLYYQYSSLIIDYGGQSEWVGDGFCDDMNNNDKCVFQGIIGPDPINGTLLWDAGDCCGSETKTDFCTDCTCISELEN